jgi:hypothetical protein
VAVLPHLVGVKRPPQVAHFRASQLEFKQSLDQFLYLNLLPIGILHMKQNYSILFFVFQKIYPVKVEKCQKTVRFTPPPYQYL